MFWRRRTPKPAKKENFNSCCIVQTDGAITDSGVLTIGGCLSPEDAATLIRRCATLAAQTDKPREFASLMKTLQGYSKLTLETEKLAKTEEPRKVMHAHLHRAEVAEENPSLNSIRTKLGLPTS